MTIKKKDAREKEIVQQSFSKRKVSISIYRSPQTSKPRGKKKQYIPRKQCILKR